MTHELTMATAPPKAPSAQTRAEADLLGVYRSRLRTMPGDVRSSITEADRPKGRDLAAIRARADTLRSFMPASEAARVAMISRLFLRFPNMARATEEQVTSYARDIAEFPAWAIARGIAAIISGVVLKTPEFPPSSLQVRAAVAEAFRPVREELGLISGLLEACERPIPDPPPEVAAERRRAMADHARQAMRNGAGPLEPAARHRPTMPSTFDDAKKQARPIALSDAARKAAGYAPRQTEDQL